MIIGSLTESPLTDSFNLQSIAFWLIRLFSNVTWPSVDVSDIIPDMLWYGVCLYLFQGEYKQYSQRREAAAGKRLKELETQLRSEGRLDEYEIEVRHSPTAESRSHATLSNSRPS